MKWAATIVFLCLALGRFVGFAAEDVRAQTASATPKARVKYDKLPDDVSPATEVRKEVLNSKGEVVWVGTTTVEKALNAVRARYRKGVLVDSKNREIRFFRSLCRGVSAGQEEDDRELAAKEKELNELRKKFLVLIVNCDPRSVM